MFMFMKWDKLDMTHDDFTQCSQEVIQDFQASVLQVADGNYNER